MVMVERIQSKLNFWIYVLGLLKKKLIKFEFIDASQLIYNSTMY